MMKLVYPGSFNPFHAGHRDVVQQALNLCDELHIVRFVNPDKPMPTGSMLEQMAAIGVPHGKKLVVAISQDAVAVYATRIQLPGDQVMLVRGVRPSGALEEIEMAWANEHLTNGRLRTILVPASKDLAFISSTLERAKKQFGL